MDRVPTMTNPGAPDYPRVSPADGVTRQVLADDPALMLVEFAFEKDAVGALHHHPHVQSTYVRSGVFEFTVGDDRYRLEPGDSLMIPSNVEHGCRAIEAGSLIDTFAPRRDDFL